MITVSRNVQMMSLLFKAGKPKNIHQTPGVSIIFKIRVFYKAWFEGFEFFIKWPYAVFHKMQVVFYKKCAFYVFQIFMKDKQCFCQMWSPIQQNTEKNTAPGEAPDSWWGNSWSGEKEGESSCCRADSSQGEANPAGLHETGQGYPATRLWSACLSCKTYSVYYFLCSQAHLEMHRLFK